MSDRAILLVLDAQACNAAQARIAYNPDRECNSLLEDLLRLVPLTSGRAHAHVMSAITHLRNLIAANDFEREAERLLAGLVDVKVDREQWSNARQVARVLRAPLADLCNPIITGVRHDAALAIVTDFVDTAPERFLSPTNASLCNELDGKARGKRKFSKLHELIAERQAVAS